MKAVVLLKLYIFEDLIVFDRLISEIYIANVTFKEIAKCCFTLWFYNVAKTMGKRKEEDDTFLRKKQKKNKRMLP